MPQLEDLILSRDLDARWNRRPQTGRLARVKGTDPPFVRLGNRIFYRRSDVEAFEAARRFMSTADARVRRESA
jgi:hypothetical protein